MGEEKEMSGEPGKTGEHFLDLLWEVYNYPKTHPETGKLIEKRESKAWKYRSETGQGFDEFGLALWTLQRMALKAVLRKGIEDCKKDGDARRLLGDILDLLENSFTDKDIKSCSYDDIDKFLDAAYGLGDDAREAMYKELYDDYGLLALDMLQTYTRCLSEGIFCEILEDYRS